MSFKKYRTNLILAIFFVVVFPLILFQMSHPIVISHVLPGNTNGFQVGIVFLTFSLSGIIGCFAGFLLAPLFLLVHKSTIGRKNIYGVQIRPEAEKMGAKRKLIFPALMAMNISIMLAFNITVRDALVHPDFIAAPDGTIWPAVTFLMILMITIGIAIALFSAVWFLDDAGIVFSNEKKVEKRSDPIEMRGVGGWYVYLLKGYAGIGAIFAFVDFWTGLVAVAGPNTMAAIVFILGAMPFIISIFSLPALIILELIKSKRVSFIRSFAKKIGISDELEIEIRKKS